MVRSERGVGFIHLEITMSLAGSRGIGSRHHFPSALEVRHLEHTHAGSRFRSGYDAAREFDRRGSCLELDCFRPNRLSIASMLGALSTYPMLGKRRARCLSNQAPSP